MSAILDPATGKPFKGEVATIPKDITFPAYLGILRIQDDTLATRGQALSYKIYDNIERDCHAYGALQKRKLAVVGRPWQVDPASKDALDIKAADMVRAQLASLGTPATADPGAQEAIAGNFDLVCYNLLDALLKGFAVGEIMWDTDGREIVIREIKTRDPRRFNFDVDYKLRLKTWTDMIPGEPVPARKFIVHSFGAKDGSPYGLGLGTRLFWPTFFKRQDITYWLTFLDKFGSPTALGTYAPGTPPSDQDKLLDALAAIAQDAGVAIPDGMAIKFLEATRGGTVSYEQFARYMDEEIDYCVLGDKGGNNRGGAQAAAAKEREEVRLELVQADADLLSGTLNATIAAWLTAYNVPGARPPKIWRQVKQPEDLKARSERDKNLAGIGFRPTLAQVQMDYGGQWEEMPPVGEGVATLPPAKGDGSAAGDVGNAFAENDTASFADQEALDAAIAALPADAANSRMAAILKPVVRFVARGGDPAEAMRKIADVYPEMDTAAFEEALARAIFVAELWGRVNAGQD